MTRLLASVRDLAEAEIVLTYGADIIDLKEPKSGALGAVDMAVLKQVVQTIDGRRPVSATIGDIPMRSDPVRRAASERFEAGADYVKVGFFPGGDVPGTLRALEREAGAGHALVAVLFADLNPPLSLLPLLAESGFSGVMLDTAGKRSGSLSDHASMAFLADFVKLGRELGMLSGLAGSLRREDVPRLLPLKPDYLGFRGALCRECRTGTIDEALTREMCALVKRAGSCTPQARHPEATGHPRRLAEQD